MYIYIYILKIRVYVQILFDVILNCIKQFNFLKIFGDFGGFNLSEKCERQKQRQAALQTIRQAEAVTDKETGSRLSPRERETDRQTGIQTDRQTD